MTSLQRHYDKVAALGCWVCRITGFGFVPPQIHHPYGRVGANASLVIPLCITHHSSGVNTRQFVSRHPWKREFERRYGEERDMVRQVNILTGKGDYEIEASHYAWVTIGP